LSLLLLENLLSMLLIAIIGYTVARKGLMSDKECAAFSRLVVNIFMPCMIMKAMQIELTEERIRGFVVLFVFALIVHAVWIILGRVLNRTIRLTAVEEATLIYSNAGNLIIPLVSALFGEEYVFYSCVFTIVQLVFMWTHGVSLIRESKSIEWKKILLNPNILSVAVGACLLVTKLPLPKPVTSAISSLGSMVGPCAMLIIGMTIAKQDLLSVFKMKRAYFVAVGRLVVFPALILVCLYLSGYLAKNPESLTLFQIAFLAVSAPPAATVSQLAVMYDRDAVNASIFNVMGVAGCVVTMPVMMYLLQLLFV
ncbi:MAG: AEC family transporter, partial [Lachnospiraceae bacterium]|nr:AEC family transporter [Lachnospiraceae bacterium]